MIPPPKPSRSSRTVLIVLSVVGVLLLICCGGASYFGLSCYRQVAKVDDEADRFASATMLAVAKPWDSGKLWDLSDADLTATLTRQQHDKLVDYYASRLGNLQSVGPFSASSTRWTTLNGSDVLIIRTSATGHFQMGDGHITLTVIRRGSTWRIDGIRIVSPLLNDNGTPSPSPRAS